MRSTGYFRIMLLFVDESISMPIRVVSSKRKTEELQQLNTMSGAFTILLNIFSIQACSMFKIKMVWKQANL